MHKKDEFIPYGIRDKKFFDKTEQDDRVRRFMEPQRIVWRSESDTANVIGAENLLNYRSPQITFSDKNLCILENKNGCSGIILDFGVEFHGYIKLFIANVSSPRLHLRIRFGESVSETMCDIGEKGATNDHINRDQRIEVGFLSMPEIGPNGFRFARIDLLDEFSSISFRAIKGIFTYRELEYKGSFRCSDERLNKIWNVGAYTVHLCMQEYLWDGIKRDRLVWIGDMHPETSTIQAVFGYDECVPKSLDILRDETPLPEVMSGMSSYSLWWILVQHGWYLQNGNKEYLEEQRNYLKSLLLQFVSYINADGSENLPEMRFIDWPAHGSENKEAVHAGLQAILKMALSAGASLCTELGENETAEICAMAAEKLSRHIPNPNGYKQAAALMALSGIADAQQMNDEVIKPGGARGLSTFMGYYTLQAQAIAGDIDGALENIRQYWGGMLDFGATTFWEDFNLDWLENASRIDEIVPEGKKDLHGDFGQFCYSGFRHSFCHGWASGPTAFLSGYVLGVQPAAPGCKQVRIKPMLGSLAWAEGSYPTPYGAIKLRHEKASDGKVITSFQAPEKVEVILE